MLRECAGTKNREPSEDGEKPHEDDALDEVTRAQDNRAAGRKEILTPEE